MAWRYRYRLRGVAGRSGTGSLGVIWPLSTAAAGRVATPVVWVAPAGTGQAAGAGFRAKCAQGLEVQTSAARRSRPLRILRLVGDMRRGLT
jgi:hypothetical protein